jgi:hypothetical protein
MSGWVKVPEEWFDQEAIERLPAEVVLFHLTALAHTARHSTNGRLPSTAVRRLWPVTDPDASVALLVTDGHWSPYSGGWFLRDWQTFVLSAEEVEHRRELNRVRQERYRRHMLGDHSMCDRCSAVKAANALRDASQDALVTPSVTPPPNRTEPTRRGGEERGAAADSAGAPPARPAHEFNPLADCCPLPPEHPCHLGATA